MRLLDIIDSFVWLKLYPLDPLRVFIQIIIYVSSVETYVFIASNFRFVSQVYKDRADVLNIAVRSLKYSIIRICAEVKSVVGTLIEDSFSGADFFVSNPDNDLVLCVHFWQRNSRVDLCH